MTKWTAACHAPLTFTVSQSLFKFMSTELVLLSNHLIFGATSPFAFCFPAWVLFFLRVSFHIRWSKYWSFSFIISAFNEYIGVISFRIDWLDLFAVQGTLKRLLQHHSSKASILQCSDFLMVQLSHTCMTTGKTIALTRWIFVDKAMALLFNMLSRLVITFLPRSKHLLISWLQSPSAAILEPQKLSQPLFSLFPHLSSVQFSHSVAQSCRDSLRLHELQHTRPPCPSPTPGVHTDSRPLSP